MVNGYCSEVVTATVRADHLARLDELAARRSLGRAVLVGKAVDSLLARDDLAGGYVGPGRTPFVDGSATEVLVVPVRSDHLRRLDDLAARWGAGRSEVIGRAIDGYLAQEALLGNFGVPGTPAWFAPAPDSSIWSARRPTPRPRWHRGGRNRSGRRDSAR